MEDLLYAFTDDRVRALVCAVVVLVAILVALVFKWFSLGKEEDPEGEIEKLMEGQTVEKVTGEQAQEDAP